MKRKANLQKFSGIWPLFGIYFQRFCQVSTKDGRKVLRISDGRRAIRSDEIQGFEGILIEVWRFSFDHFYKVTLLDSKG